MAAVWWLHNQDKSLQADIINTFVLCLQPPARQQNS